MALVQQVSPETYIPVATQGQVLLRPARITLGSGASLFAGNVGSDPHNAPSPHNVMPQAFKHFCLKYVNGYLFWCLTNHATRQKTYGGVDV
jgi:hypothetical protein